MEIKTGDLVRLKTAYRRRVEDSLVGVATSIKHDVVYVMWLNHPDENNNYFPYNSSSLIKVKQTSCLTRLPTWGILSVRVSTIKGERTMTDEQLMNSFVAGSQTSFSLLSKKWSQKLLTFIKKKVGREELAQELVQDTLINVYRNADKWNPEEHKFSAWIYSIARNVIVSSVRTKKAKMEVLWIDEEQNKEFISEDPLTKMFLSKAVDSLPEHLAQAFKLTYIEGMDHNEACEVANISPDNMRARASRARFALREMVA